MCAIESTTFNPLPPGCTAGQSEVEALRAELVASQRRILLGDLAAIATHEFNNLLTPVVTRTEAALMSGDVAYMKKTLERSFVQAQRAVAVNQHLLGMARNQPLRWNACAVGAVVREAVDTFPRPLEKDSIELRVEVPDGLQIWACEPLLCQVLLNLILNAHRAMKGQPGGHQLAISASVDGELVQIDVRDTGVGFPPDRLEAVVQYFRAAPDERRPGSWQPGGLGLSACRLIARLHGAQITALANETRGVTFRLRWPSHGPVTKADA